MSQNNTLPHPSCMWHDTPASVTFTIKLEDCKNPIIKIEPESLYFKGVGGTDKKEHELTLNLYKPIVPAKCTQNVKERIIELNLVKQQEEVWATLTKEKVKLPWLKLDFDRYSVDNSDSEEKDGGMSELMQKLTQYPPEENNRSPDFNDDATDSDDDVPDLIPSSQ